MSSLHKHLICVTFRVLALNLSCRCLSFVNHIVHCKPVQECGGETLDCGASKAFALCDHQVAHIHLESAEDINEVHTVQCVLTTHADTLPCQVYIVYGKAALSTAMCCARLASVCSLIVCCVSNCFM